MKNISTFDTILVVVNPIAGGQDKTPIVEKIKKISDDRSKFKIYHTTGKKDKQTIKNLIDDINPERILVVGGDGTIKLVSDVVGNKIIIGIIPAGSSNGLATDLDIPENTEKALDIAMGTNIKCIDSLKINKELGLHISDIGLNAELIKEYSNSKIRGRFGYALNSIPTLIKSNMPYKFKIKTPDRVWEDEAIMIAFANSQKFGTGVNINPNGKLNDGLFEVILFKELDPIDILKTIMGKIELNSDFVEIIQTKKVSVYSEKPIYLQVDGETCEKEDTFHVTIQPDFIRLAQI